MTPLLPGALKRQLQALPPERPDPFPHLASLSTDQLLMRRVEITCRLKNLEHGRQIIDAELLRVFSEAGLRFGVCAPGGWILKQRSRTSWDYCPEVRDAIKDLQQEAQRDGMAQQVASTHLCLSQESA